MAYYGILMKDGSELTHYGVKGMKWGKSSNKPKGVFGNRKGGLVIDKTFETPEGTGMRKVTPLYDVNGRTNQAAIAADQRKKKAQKKHNR